MKFLWNKKLNLNLCTFHVPRLYLNNLSLTYSPHNAKFFQTSILLWVPLQAEKKHKVNQLIHILMEKLLENVCYQHHAQSKYHFIGTHFLAHFKIINVNIFWVSSWESTTNQLCQYHNEPSAVADKTNI